jgi:hypothetical protein
MRFILRSLFFYSAKSATWPSVNPTNLEKAMGKIARGPPAAA